VSVQSSVLVPSTNVSEGGRQFSSSLTRLFAFLCCLVVAIAISITRLIKYLSSVLITS
jgi:hypothetical protein